jgi:hypothetical protein
MLIKIAVVLLVPVAAFAGNKSTVESSASRAAVRMGLGGMLHRCSRGARCFDI